MRIVNGLENIALMMFVTSGCLPLTMHRGCNQWVNYFLHAGHLEIEGLKMSKSLKNFISIK